MNEHGLRVRLAALLLDLTRRERAPLWAAKIHGGPYQRAGIPDWLICADGRFAAIETKHPDASVVVATPAQALELAAITRAGGATLVSNDLVEIESFVRHLLGR